MGDIRRERWHRFLEAWREEQNAKAGRTLSHVEVAKMIGFRSAPSLAQQTARNRDVRDFVLFLIRIYSPEHGDLIDSLIKDDEGCSPEWDVEIQKIHDRIKEGRCVS